MKFTTVEEVFDGFDELPFERQLKRMIAASGSPIERELWRDDRTYAWEKTYRPAIRTAGYDGTCAKLREEIAAENKELEDVQILRTNT